MGALILFVCTCASNSRMDLDFGNYDPIFFNCDPRICNFRLQTIDIEKSCLSQTAASSSACFHFQYKPSLVIAIFWKQKRVDLKRIQGSYRNPPPFFFCVDRSSRINFYQVYLIGLRPQMFLINRLRPLSQLVHHFPAHIIYILGLVYLRQWGLLLMCQIVKKLKGHIKENYLWDNHDTYDVLEGRSTPTPRQWETGKKSVDTRLRSFSPTLTLPLPFEHKEKEKVLSTKKYTFIHNCEILSA